MTAGRRFTVVDELACYFDRPGEPNNVHLELAVAGRLDSVRLRAALAATLGDQDAARTRRAPWRWYHRGFTWEVGDTPDLDPLTFAAGDLAEQRRLFLATAPPLDKSPPLRLRLVRVSGAEEVLMLNAHHAALDGPSCLHLLTAIARHYAEASGERPPVGPKCGRVPAAGPAASRGEAPDPAASMPTVPRSVVPGPAVPGAAVPRPAVPRRASVLAAYGPVAAPRVRSARPARIAADGGRPVPGCGIRAVTVGVPVARAGCTVNDLLVAAMARTVAVWNGRHGRYTGTVRVTVPVNGRPPGRPTEPLGNLSRLSTVVVPAADRRSPHRLLACVAAQNPRHHRAGGSPVGAMSWTLGNRWLPVGVKAVLTDAATRLGGPLVDTVLLSNLGRLTEVPDFGDAGPAVAAGFSGPAPMPRGLSLCAITVADRLHLCFRHRYALLDDDAAGRFTATYVAALHDLAGAVGDGGSGR